MKLIVASDPDGGIGYNNKLPWSRIQGDLPRFKKLTSGKIVVMGRNTWDSLPVKPLPNRTNYVVTSNPHSLPHIPGLYGITDLNTLAHFNDAACIIGGARLINSVWHLITSVNLSRTFTKYTCDTFIDLLQLPKEFSLTYDEVNTDHTYEIWNRK
jgi:dihydrofolate reductase